LGIASVIVSPCISLVLVAIGGGAHLTVRATIGYDPVLRVLSTV